MIPAGSILNYQAKGVTSWFPSEATLIQEMNSEFAQANITMRDYHFATSPGSVVGSVDAYLGAPVNFQITATLQTNSDFNSPQDVASIADHAIYQVTGALPASTVPSVTVPGATAADTGQPGQAAPPASGASGFDLSSILQGGVNSFALLMMGVILAVVLIVAGKSKGIV